jgi:hypothetical protein
VCAGRDMNLSLFREVRGSMVLLKHLLDDSADGLKSIHLKLTIVDDQVNLLVRLNNDLLDVLATASNFAEADPRDKFMQSWA